MLHFESSLVSSGGHALQFMSHDMKEFIYSIRVDHVMTFILGH